MPGDDVAAALASLALPLPAVVIEGGIVVAANPAALALGPHAFENEPLATWFDADDAHIVAGAFGQRGHRRPAVARVRDRAGWLAIHTTGADAGERQVVVLRDASEEVFAQAAVDAVADSTFVIGADGVGRWRSARLRARSVHSDAEAARRPSGERVHPEDLPRVFEAFGPGTGPGPARVVARSQSVDDDTRWEHIELVVWNETADEVLDGFLVQVHNLDTGRSVHTTLAEADPELFSLTEAAPVGIAVTDPAGMFVYRNPAARALLGPGIRSFGDLDWLDLALAEHRTALATAFDAALHDGEEHTITAAFLNGDGAGGADGAETWLRLRLDPQRSALGGPKGLIVTIEDVSEQVSTSAALAAAEQQMRYLATHDSLTGLPNRAALNDELERAARRHARSTTGLSVLFCDLDRFKPVNDRLGHAGGDAVLVEVANRLRASVRAADFVARLGGDEFVVLCETSGDDSELIDELTERLVRNVGQPIAVGGDAVSVGVSVGIATAPAGTEANADLLLTEADTAMYRRKAIPRRTRA